MKLPTGRSWLLIMGANTDKGRRRTPSLRYEYCWLVAVVLDPGGLFSKRARKEGIGEEQDYTDSMRIREEQE